MAALHPNHIVLLSNFIPHRILTVKQLSALSGRSMQVIRRAIRKLVEKNILAKDDTFYSNRPGRREELVYLTQVGIDTLQSLAILPENDQYLEIQKDSIPVDHNLLVTWFHIHIQQIERICPDLAVYAKYQDFYIRVNNDSSQETFIPDGIFSIVKNSDRKGLLFFLEVDMGTESYGSNSERASTIDKKILNYQHFFLSKQYKQFEDIFGCTFNGFRLLIVASEYLRHISLCKRVQAICPNNFIWLTDQVSMFKNGLGDMIWAAGGDHEKAARSILGSLSCPTPLPFKF